MKVKINGRMKQQEKMSLLKKFIWHHETCMQMDEPRKKKHILSKAIQTQRDKHNVYTLISQ